MDKHSKISEDELLGPLVIAAFQECIATENFDGFKVICRLQISRFNLFAQGNVADWNRFISYIEANCPEMYLTIAVDALLDFLTEWEFHKQATGGELNLGYPLSNGMKDLMAQANIEFKAAGMIAIHKLQQEKGIIKRKNRKIIMCLLVIISLLSSITILTLSKSPRVDTPTQFAK